MELSAFRTLVIVLILLSGTNAGSLAYAALLCTDLGDEWDLRNGEVASTSGSYVLKATNNRLRQLNNDVFGGWTRGSEYLSDVLHFLFQYHLDGQVRSHSGVRVVDRTLEYVKTLDVGFRLDNMKRADVVASVEIAKASALRDLHRLIFENDGSVLSLVRRVTGPNSELAQGRNFAFSEGRRHLDPLSPGEMQRLQRDLTRAFPEGSQFISMLRQGYGLGLGRTSADAEFAAKLSSLKSGGYGPAVFFDNITLYRVLRSLRVQRDHLDWLFAGESEASLLEIFKAMRTNQGKSNPLQWTQALREIIGKAADLSTPAGRERGERLWHDVQKFIRTLNILDYLPVEWAKVDPVGRTKFNSLTKPDGALFIDFKGLGARNYLAMYKQIDGLLARLSTVDRLVKQRDTLGSSESARRAEIDGEIHTILESVVAVRENILQSTNDYLVAGKQAVARIIEDVGIGKQDYAIWASGDDLFVIFRGQGSASASVDAMRVARAVAGEPALGNGVRIAAMKLDSRNSFMLDEARVSVGRCADPLKELEALRLPYQILMEFVPGAIPSLRVGRYTEAGGLTPLPAADFAKVVQTVKGWSIRQVQ